MSFNKKIYRELLADALPRVIDSDKEYDRLEKIFEVLFDTEKTLSPEEEELCNLLAILLEEYESRTLEPPPKASPIEILAYLMKENNLKQADLVGIFNTQSTVSEVLNGKREITKNQAKALAERFKMNVGVFL